MDSSFLTTDTDYLLAFLVATRSLRVIGHDLRLYCVVSLLATLA